MIHVGMRLILTGIAALIAGCAFGLALQSEGRHEIGSADAELRVEPPRLSVFGTIHPKRFDLPAPLGSQSLLSEFDSVVDDDRAQENRRLERLEAMRDMFEEDRGSAEEMRDWMGAQYLDELHVRMKCRLHAQMK